MSAPRLVGLAALLSICFACQTAFAASDGAAPPRVQAGLLPPARHALQLEVRDVQVDNLEVLLTQLGEATGVEFAIDEVARAALRQTRTGLADAVTVPAEEAWRWAEGLLLRHGYKLGGLSLRSPFLVGVYGQPRQGGAAQPEPIHVSADDLELCNEHPAFVYLTLLDLPHVDVRQLGNSLRVLMNDPSGGVLVVPVGNTNTVLLNGTGVQVSRMAAILNQVEERAREIWEGHGTPPGVMQPGQGDMSPPPPGGQGGMSSPPPGGRG